MLEVPLILRTDRQQSRTYKSTKTLLTCLLKKPRKKQQENLQLEKDFRKRVAAILQLTKLSWWTTHHYAFAKTGEVSSLFREKLVQGHETCSRLDQHPGTFRMHQMNRVWIFRVALPNRKIHCTSRSINALSNSNHHDPKTNDHIDHAGISCWSPQQNPPKTLYFCKMQHPSNLCLMFHNLFNTSLRYFFLLVQPTTFPNQ